MSLGGFAQGLAGAFQKAEDRYQERKLREQASAEAKLRQAAGFAFREKMYTRQMRDAYNDELTKTRNYLSTVFGADDTGKAYVSALLPFGEAAIDIVKDHKQQALDRGVDFKSFMNIAHPNGIDKNTYKAPDLDNVLSFLSKKKFGEDVSGFDFKLPTVSFKDIPQATDYTSKFTGSTAEGTLQLVTNGILDAKRNIERGVEVTKYQNQLKDLQALELSAIAQIEKEAQASSGSLGTPEVTGSLTGAINRDIVQKVTSNVKGDIVTFSGEQIFNIDYEGNEKLAIDGALSILSTLPSSFRVYNPSQGTRGAIQTLGPKNAYASGYYQKLILPTNQAINVAKRRAEENPEDIVDLTQFGDLYSDPLNPATKAKIIETIGYKAGDVNLRVAKYIKNGKTVINPVGEFTRERTDKNPNGFFVYKPLSLQDYQKFVGVNY
tara:strand:- start:5283 stop:6590 length:1308 start_codon:yes stop_codon:yes gene_type:complete